MAWRYRPFCEWSAPRSISTLQIRSHLRLALTPVAGWRLTIWSRPSSGRVARTLPLRLTARARAWSVSTSRPTRAW